jgi:hypothetical protein
MIKITKRNKEEEEFTPHMAMTHMEINGGAANGQNKPIFLKSNNSKPLSTSTLASIEKLEGKKGVTKASYINLKRMLEQALRLESTNTLGEDTWVWLKDFDSNTVVFELDGILHGASYSLSDTGMVLLQGDAKEAIQQDVYVTDDGKSLVLKYKDLSPPSGEINTKGVSPDKGNNDMSKELEDQIEVLQKAVQDQDATIAKAVTKALADQAITIEKAALTSATTEIVKGFNAVDEADQLTLVKSLVSLGDEAALIIKAFSNMQEQVVKANEDLALANESAEAIKKEFGKTDDEGVTVDSGQLSGNKLSMKDAVAKAKSRQKS